MGRSVAAVVVAAVVVLTAACGDDGDGSGGTSSTTPTEALSGHIVVFAAASLTDAFEAIADAFEVANPGTSVELSFAGSSSLREQILDGAPADVFAAANPSNMEAIVDAGEAAAADVAVFGHNELQIAVPAGNEAGVTGLADFARDDLLIGLCAEEVPCGQFGREALDHAGVTPAVDTDEPDVRALLSKVAADELDAGLVYRTDVLSAGETVEGIDVPDEDNVIADYPISVLTRTSAPFVAEAFVAFVLAEDGQAILDSFGFRGP